ncbi:MAG: hypothetical protein H6737_23730 [Alphaproteobacteria bacterium]|nr:hypothetical protein [Alphaproteobacteria bacterium]
MWMLLAGAAAAPRYNTVDLAFDAGDLDDTALHARVRRLLEKTGTTVRWAQGDERIAIHPKPATDFRLGHFERPAMLALWLGLQLEDRSDTEYDLILADRRGKPCPVTLWVEGANDLVVTQGAPLGPPPIGPDSGELVRRYGLAGIEERDARFEPRVRGALDAALGMLSPGELAALSDITLVRRGGPTRRTRVEHPPGWVSTATYVLEGQQAWIEVYDEAVVDSARFVGPVDRPQHPTVFVLLHEIGHALADARFRRLVREYETRRLRYNQRVADLESALAGFNAQVVAHNAAPTSRRARELRQVRKLLDAREDGLQADEDALEALSARLDAEEGTMHLSRRFAAETGGRSPTAYGDRSADEAFAEAFALFHVDPEALKRTLPDAWAWFARGAHLEPGVDR